MALFLGIDLGTSYFKVGLFDEAGALRGLGRVAVEKDTPAPNRSELPIYRFWELLRRGLHEALAQARAKADQIAGVSYSSQANTFVLLDREDLQLTPLVVWTDTRGDPVPAAMAAFAHTPEFRATVGFDGIGGAWAVAKWEWYRRQQPDTWARTRRVMTISDYLTFSLTGERAGDAGTASFLGLYDLARRTWWPRALEVFQIESAQLSTPLLPGQAAGRTAAGATHLLGLPAGIPFAVGGLDHHVAALGAGAGTLADLSLSTGTVLAAMALVPQPAPQRECYHGPHFEGGTFYRLAFDGNGAGQLEEYQRQHAPGLTIEQLLALAAQRAPGSGQAVRALLERVAVAQKALVAQVAGPAAVRAIAATGGGARSPLWLQIQADILNVPIVTTACAEPACLGAAMLAAIRAGAFANGQQATQAMVQVARCYQPGDRSSP